MKIASQVVLITGGSSGIGAATAALLAREGATVYAASRRGTSEAVHERIIPVVLDVNDEAATEALVRRIVDEQGRLDAVVVNAGNGIYGAIEETSDAELRAQFETCLFGAMKTVRACLPVMRRQGHGRIITTTSVAAIVPLPFQGGYSAVKAAMLTLTETLSMELQGSGIQCSSVLPGDTATGFTGARKRTAAAAEDVSPYKARMEKNLKKIEHDEQTGMSPDVIARAIRRQLRRRRMRPRVIPRLDYQAVGFLMRMVPTRTKLWLLNLLYA